MKQTLLPFLYFFIYFFFWGLASYFIYKRFYKTHNLSKVIIIGGGFLAINFILGIIGGISSFFIENSSNSISSTQNTPEQYLHGINLEASKDEILSSFPKGFKECSSSRSREICIWKKGTQNFEIIHFYNQKISQIDFLSSQDSFNHREEVLQYSQPIIESIQSGLQFTPEHIGAGFRGAGLHKMKEGDYYLLGCRAYRPYYRGKLKMLGFGGANFLINECSDETFGYLNSTSLIYESDDYSAPSDEN